MGTVLRFKKSSVYVWASLYFHALTKENHDKTAKLKIKNKKTSIIILFVSVLSLFVWSRFKTNERKNIIQNGKYTICYIDNIQYSKGIPGVSFHYYFGGIRYEGNDACSNPSLEKNYIGIFLVDTKEIVLMCECSIENAELKALEFGWESLPEGICRKSL